MPPEKQAAEIETPDAAAEAAALAAEQAEAPVKTASELAREDIYARARASREAEVAEAAKDPQVKILDQFAGQSAEEPADTAHADVDGDTDKPTGQAEAAPVTEGAGQPAPEVSEDGKIKLVVYGEERYVDEEAVFEAGLRTLQKDAAADYRMKQAQAAEQRLHAYRKELDDYHASVKKMADDLKAGRAITTEQAAAVTAPPQARGATDTATAQKIAEAAKKVAQTIYMGEPEETAKALETLITDVAQGRSATPPAVDVDAVAQAAAEKLRAEEQERQAQTIEQRRAAVNQTFAGEFAKVVEHDEAFAVAQARFNLLLSKPENQSRDWTELAREAGRAALHRYPELQDDATTEQRTEPSADDAVSRTLAERRRVKSKTVVPPSRSTARQTPPPPARPPSSKEYLAEMRRARGLPPA